MIYNARWIDKHLASEYMSGKLIVKAVHNLPLLAMHLSAAFILTACGLADPNDPNAARTDTIAPQIMSVKPESLTLQKAIDVDTHTVVIEFNESVKPSATWADHITISPAIAGTWEYTETEKSTGGKTYALVFTRADTTPLPYDTTYTLTVKAEINDAQGNSLEQQYTYTFRSTGLNHLSGQVKGLVGTLTIEDTSNTAIAAADRTAVITSTNSPDTKSFALTRGYLTGDVFNLKLTHGADTTVFCSADRQIGTFTGGNQSLTITCDRVKPAYVNGADWNTYVRPNGDACEKFSDCFHAGEMRSFSPADVTACSSLTARDRLDLFDWKCEKLASGEVRFVSKMKPTTRLSDLINFDAMAWRKNNVTVLLGGQTIDSSSDAPWWNSPIINLSEESGTTSAWWNNGPSASGAVYVVTKPSRGIYNIKANNIALVVKDTAAIEGYVTVESRYYTWFEGAVNAYQHEKAVTVTGSAYAILHNVTAQNATKYGIYFDRDALVTVHDSLAYNNGTSGIFIGSSPNTTLYNVRSIDNAGHGIIIDGNYNKLSNVTTASNAGSGIYVVKGLNTFTEISSFNNRVDGISIIGATTNILSRVTASSNSGKGIRIADGTGNNAAYNIVSNSTVVYNAGGGVDVAGNHDNTLINVADSFNTDSACSASPCNGVTTVSGDATAYGNYYVGNKLTAETSFQTDLFTALPTHAYMSWGVATGAGACSNADNWYIGCMQRDFSLKTTATALFGLRALPGTAKTPVSFINTSDQPIYIDIVENAFEVANDAIGNDNGLCEDNETCVYAPNVGSYQGHGDLIAETSVSIPGITLMKYTTNGY